MRVVAYSTIHESVTCHTKSKNDRNIVTVVRSSVNHLIYSYVAVSLTRMQCCQFSRLEYS